MTRHLLSVLGIWTAAFVLVARAEDSFPKVASKSKPTTPAVDEGDPKVKIEDAANQQDRLKRQFDEFKQMLLRLAQQMENSPRPEDKSKAQNLKLAVQKASEEGIETKFGILVDALRQQNLDKDIERLQQVKDQNEALRRDLRAILELLMQDDSDSARRAKMREIQRLMEQIKILIAKQDKVHARNMLGQQLKSVLEAQKKVSEQTRNLVEPRDGKSSKNALAKNGEAKGTKGGKDGLGEGKDDTKQAKGEGRKGSEGKEGKAGQGKEGKEGKSSQAKEGKSAEAKSGKSDADKSGPQSEAKPGKGEAGESKGRSDNKGQAKSGQGSQGQQGEAKSGSQSGNQAQAKSGSQQGGQQSGQQGGQQGNPQQGQQQQGQENPVKKQIAEAHKYQQQAETDLEKQKRNEAGQNQENASEKLRDALKKLEDLLRQMREEEIEKLLAQLEMRCRRMLALQIAVRDGTVDLDKIIGSNADKKATRENQQTSLGLADKEDEIVKEAATALRLIEAEGSAVAFAEVFKQVHGDMVTVWGRLRKTDVGVVTVTIENDIIATLQEMIEALKKARQDNKSGSAKSSGGGQQDQKLIDMIAELKMIRSMQLRVNARTEVYGKQYEGEQAPSPEAARDSQQREHYEMIQQELKDLAARQQKIGKVTHDIATGKNENR